VQQSFGVVRQVTPDKALQQEFSQSQLRLLQARVVYEFLALSAMDYYPGAVFDATWQYAKIAPNRVQARWLVRSLKLANKFEQVYEMFIWCRRRLNGKRRQIFMSRCALKMIRLSRPEHHQTILSTIRDDKQLVTELVAFCSQL
jgi:hypothetical protein